MKKLKTILSENKFIIILTLISIILAIVEIVSAQNEILYRKNYGMSPAYGIRDIVMIILYLGFLIYFSFTLKKRRRLEFLLALFLMITMTISYIYINFYSFALAAPYDYYKLVGANPVIFKIAHYTSLDPNIQAEYQGTFTTFSLNFIAAIISCIACAVSISICALKLNKNAKSS